MVFIVPRSMVALTSGMVSHKVRVLAQQFAVTFFFCKGEGRWVWPSTFIWQWPGLFSWVYAIQIPLYSTAKIYTVQVTCALPNTY